MTGLIISLTKLTERLLKLIESIITLVLIRINLGSSWEGNYLDLFNQLTDPQVNKMQVREDSHGRSANRRHCLMVPKAFRITNSRVKAWVSWKCILKCASPVKIKSNFLKTKNAKTNTILANHLSKSSLGLFWGIIWWLPMWGLGQQIWEMSRLKNKDADLDVQSQVRGFGRNPWWQWYGWKTGPASLRCYHQVQLQAS